MAMQPNQPGVMAEDASAGSQPGADNGEGQAQTAEIPAALFEGQALKPGDVFEFKVVSVDANSGTVTVAYNHGEEDGDGGGGSDSMAKEFDNPTK